METTKLANRLASSSGELNVQLGNLSTSDLAGIGDVGAGLRNDVPQVLATTDGKIAGGELVGEELSLGGDVDLAAVLEGGIGETETKFVARSGVLLVEVLVVDIVALREIDNGLLADLGVRVVVGFVLGEGVDELARGVDIAEEHIVDSVAGRLAKRSAVEDTGDVLVSGPLVN